MPVYLFEIAPFLAGRSVTVRDAVSGSDVASGTLDQNAKFTASLPVGDYVASASDGNYTYRASGVVDQGDPDRLADSALSSTYAATIGASTGTDDTAKINALLSAARTAGGGQVRGLPGQTYRISAPLIVGSKTTLDMTGCTVSLNAGSDCNLLNNYAVAAVASATDGAMTSGSTTLTTALAGLAVGQSVTVSGAGNGGNSPLAATVVSVGAGTATLSVPAQATVSAATVKRYVRDSNVRVVGGTWARGGNGGSGLNLHNLLFRRVDGLHFAPESITSAAGKYAVSVADATKITGRLVSLSTASDGLHLMGPIDGAHIDTVSGTTGDDIFAITAADWSPYNDTSGDVRNVVVGSVIGTSTNARLTIVTAGNGCFVDAVSVGRIYGNTQVTHAVRVGEDTGQAQTTGGSYGSIDLGEIAATSPNPAALLFMQNPTAKRIKARIRNSQTSGLNRAAYITGNNTATLEHLELDVDVDAAANSAFLSVFEANGSATTVNRLVMTGRYVMPTGLVSPLFQVSNGTVVEAAVSARVKGSAQTGYAVRQVGGTLTRLNFIGGTVDSTSVAYRRDPGPTSPTMVTMAGGFACQSTSRVADCRSGTITFKLNGPHFDTVTNAAFFTNAATLIFDGTISTNGTFSMLQRNAAESVRSLSAVLPFDLNALAKNSGDMANNTNAAHGAGVGPAISNGTAWKNLYTGTAA